MARGMIRNETAPSSAHGIREMYIGELSPDPRQRARYSSSIWIDDAATIQLYRDVLGDQRASQALDQRLNASVSRDWSVKPGGAAGRDRMAADSLSEILMGIDFDSVCKKLLFAVWYGYSVAEVIWTPDGRRVAIEDIRLRAAERFRWDADNQPLLRTRAAPLGVPLEDMKFIVIRNPGDHDDIPYYPGLARWCYWPAFLKRHGLKFWTVALEKFGTPSTKGTYQRSATEDEKDRLMEVLTALSTGIAAIVPEGQDIEIIEATRRSGGDFEVFCRYLDTMIATRILGQSSTTDQGPWRGTAEVQMEVRDESVAADCQLLDAALNRSLAKWLTEWNHPGAACPVIRRDTDAPEDLNARVDREEKISRITGLRPTRRHIEEVYGGEWEESPMPNPEGGAGSEFAGAASDPITLAAVEAARDWRVQMEPVVDPALRAADGASDLDGLRSDIDGLDGQTDTEALEDRLTNLRFSTAVSGRAE